MCTLVSVTGKLSNIYSPHSWEVLANDTTQPRKIKSEPLILASTVKRKLFWRLELFIFLSIFKYLWCHKSNKLVEGYENSNIWWKGIWVIISCRNLFNFHDCKNDFKFKFQSKIENRLTKSFTWSGCKNVFQSWTLKLLLI